MASFNNHFDKHAADILRQGFGKPVAVPGKDVVFRYGKVVRALRAFACNLPPDEECKLLFCRDLPVVEGPGDDRLYLHPSEDGRRWWEVRSCVIFDILPIIGKRHRHLKGILTDNHLRAYGVYERALCRVMPGVLQMLHVVVAHVLCEVLQHLLDVSQFKQFHFSSIFSLPIFEVAALLLGFVLPIAEDVQKLEGRHPKNLVPFATAGLRDIIYARNPSPALFKCLSASAIIAITLSLSSLFFSPFAWRFEKISI